MTVADFALRQCIILGLHDQVVEIFLFSIKFAVVIVFAWCVNSSPKMLFISSDHFCFEELNEFIGLSQIL